jgi:hypothetical protein
MARLGRARLAWHGTARPGEAINEKGVAVGCAKCGREEQLRRGLCKNCWQNQRIRVGWESSYVDAQPTRAHVNLLIAAGLGTRRISALSGVNRKAITQLLHGRPDRGTGPSVRVSAHTAARIQAIPIPAERHHLAADHTPVLAVGSTRRLQALVCIGYTQSYLAGRLGITVTNMRDVIHARRVCVTAARARDIEAVYQELHLTPPPDGRWTRYSRRYAQARDWVDPFGWEDEDIDNPEAIAEVI